MSVVRVGDTWSISVDEFSLMSWGCHSVCLCVCLCGWLVCLLVCLSVFACVACCVGYSVMFVYLHVATWPSCLLIFCHSVCFVD